MKDYKIYIHPVQVGFSIEVATEEKEPSPETIRLAIVDEVRDIPTKIEFEHDGPSRASWVNGDE